LHTTALRISLFPLWIDSAEEGGHGNRRKVLQSNINNENVRNLWKIKKFEANASQTKIHCTFAETREKMKGRAAANSRAY
jgi:hypothetical protein